MGNGIWKVEYEIWDMKYLPVSTTASTTSTLSSSLNGKAASACAYPILFTVWIFPTPNKTGVPSIRDVGSGLPWNDWIVASSSKTALWMFRTSCLTVWPVGRRARGGRAVAWVRWGRRVRRVVQRGRSMVVVGERRGLTGGGNGFGNWTGRR